MNLQGLHCTGLQQCFGTSPTRFIVFILLVPDPKFSSEKRIQIRLIAVKYWEVTYTYKVGIQL
jgi:hypothetical protein